MLQTLLVFSLAVATHGSAASPTRVLAFTRAPPSNRVQSPGLSDGGRSAFPVRGAMSSMSSMILPVSVDWGVLALGLIVLIVLIGLLWAQHASKSRSQWADMEINGSQVVVLNAGYGHKNHDTVGALGRTMQRLNMTIMGALGCRSWQQRAPQPIESQCFLDESIL